MKLEKGILRPGRVIEVCEHGNIKADVPGLFSKQDKENLPEIMPFFGGHANSFSSVNKDDEVWVLNYSDNALSLHWFRKDDHVTADSDLIDGSNVEILLHREGQNGWATIMFEDGRGMLLQNNNSIINITTDGNIILDTTKSSRAISIDDNSISLGTVGGSSHDACYGDVNKDCWNRLCDILDQIAMVASTNILTVGIGTAISSRLTDLKSQIPQTVSTNVTLD